jgi:hypothetical protein
LIPDSKLSDTPTAAAASVFICSTEPPSPQYSTEELFSRSDPSTWTWEMSEEERFNACAQLFDLHRKWQAVIKTSIENEFHAARQAYFHLCLLCHIY